MNFDRPEPIKIRPSCGSRGDVESLGARPGHDDVTLFQRHAKAIELAGEPGDGRGGVAQNGVGAALCDLRSIERKRRLNGAQIIEILQSHRVAPEHDPT